MNQITSESQSRLDYVDLAKCVAILLVVAGHIVQCFFARGENEPLHAFIYGFHMPLFFLLSGFVMGVTQQRLRQQSFWDWLLHKILTLLLPYVVWRLFVYRFVDPAGESSIDMDAIRLLIRNSRSGGAWFLMSLFCIQVVCYPIVRYKKLYAWCIPFLLLVVGHFLGGSWYYCNPYHYVSFLAGYVFYLYQDRLIRPDVASFALICFIVFEIVYPNPIILTFSISISLLYACKRFCGIPNYRSSLLYKGGMLIGRNTLAIYLLHVLIVFPVVMQHLDISFFRQTPILIITLAISVLVPLICVGITKIVEFFPILSLILFGKISKD